MVSLNPRSFLNFFTRSRNVSPKQFTFNPEGGSGTEIYSAMFTEEYLTKLLSKGGIAVYDQMRRSDGQVAMLLKVVKNPIKSARNSIEAAGEEPEQIEQAEFIDHVLFHDISTPNGQKKKSFRDFIIEALTFVEFGHSVFEVVHKNVKGHPVWGDYLGLADLGFRHQRSIDQWVLNEDGSINHVHQVVYGDNPVDAVIPGQHLLVFSNEKEGDNYEGISWIRPCYGSYFRKNIYRKLQAIGIERASKGIPVGKMPLEMLERSDWETQLTAFQTIIDQLSSHEKNGIVIGPGYDLTELKISHDSQKVQAVINSENVEMSKSFLANFMELGLEQNGGSYALGSDLSDIFLAGIACVGDMIEEVVNESLIKPLINAKYGPQEKYPKFKFKGINDKGGKELADVLVALAGAGLIQNSAAVKAHAHKMFNLPDFDPDVEEELEAKRQEKIDEEKLNKQPVVDPKKKLSEHDHTIYRLNDEEKEKFPVSAMIETHADQASVLMRAGLEAGAVEILDNAQRIIRSGGSNVRADVMKLKFPNPKEYVDLLREWAGGTGQQARADVIAELKLSQSSKQFADSLSTLPKFTRDKILSLILLTASAQTVGIEQTILFAFAGNYESVDDETTIDEMNAASERYFDKKVIEVGATNMASKVVNTVRHDTYIEDDIASDIESFVFKNPSPVSDICQTLNGRVFSKEELDTTPNYPPLHHNCKSYVVAQTVGESGNKPLTRGGLTVTDPKILRSKTL